MAIAKIKKIEIIGLEIDKDKILALLQKLGVVELIEAAKEGAPAVLPAPLPEELGLLEFQETISYLASFERKKGLLAGVTNIKPFVYEQQIKEVFAKFDYKTFLNKIAQLRNHLKNLSQHRERLLQEKQLLAPWDKLKIPLDQLGYTKSCGIFLGALRTVDYAKLREDCRAQEIGLFCEAVKQDKTNTFLAIIYIKEAFERLEAILKSYHFNFMTLGHHKGAARDRLSEIVREIMILGGQMQEAKDKITHFSQDRFKLMVVYDYLQNKKGRQEIERNLAKQQFTFSLSGWLRQADIGLLEKELKRNFREVAVFISAPKEDEGVPVILENRRLIQPFEFITEIYGMPKYNELDPTPFLAPFFFIYFGLCVSDAGYGIILVLFSLFVLKKFRLGPQGVKFFRLFLFCGISTIIIGAAMGSWFGNLFDLIAENNKAFLPLKTFKDALVVLDPAKEPTKLLGLALSFGVIQVWFGNIVAAIGNLKNKRYPDILFDQVSMLTFLFGLTGLGLIFLKLLPDTRLNLFKAAALLGAVALILTQGRSEKGPGAKLFYGVYNLYNSLSGYLSDILSYSRLWALGLVTGVMAMTINLISMQFSAILTAAVPVINKISSLKAIVGACVLIIIFILGHLASFLMNLLGAFVHPVRLQFVEFFSKFFKPGGSTFRPFKVKTKYINISGPA